jgi:hypothetical protein
VSIATGATFNRLYAPFRFASPEMFNPGCVPVPAARPSHVLLLAPGPAKRLEPCSVTEGRERLKRLVRGNYNDVSLIANLVEAQTELRWLSELNLDAALGEAAWHTLALGDMLQHPEDASRLVQLVQGLVAGRQTPAEFAPGPA